MLGLFQEKLQKVFQLNIIPIGLIPVHNLKILEKEILISLHQLWIPIRK